MEKMHKTQMDKINKMLLEMASGNFFFRLPRSNNQDSVEAMILVLNMLAEEIQEAMIQQGQPSIQGKMKYSIQMNFLLDALGTIELVNKHTCMALSFHLKDFIGKPFGHFLDGPSNKHWLQLQRKLTRKKFFDILFETTFVTKSGLLVPSTAHITTCMGNQSAFQKTMITVVHYSRDVEEREKKLLKEIRNFKERKDASQKNPDKLK